MPPRYITDRKYEIQVRDFFPSMLNAIHNLYSTKSSTLIKNGIRGINVLEFRNFNRLDKKVKINYQNTYRLNGRYAFTISGECSDNCITVLLMITDRQTKAHFGFTVKVGADSSRQKAFHVVANIPLFGIHCHIKYNPDTKFFVIGCRDPFDIEEEVESGTTICLTVDFVKNRISDDIFFEFCFFIVLFNNLIMASRYINDDNFEIQVRNCFSSMLDAIESHHPFNRITALSKNDIIGLRLLEFNTFDSRLHDGEEIRPNYRYTYRLNRRYALTVSGEYSNDCLTVLLMITDRQTEARFGFKVKIAANSYRRKTLHIIAKIPIFGVHCVINYNPYTKYYVFSIRPPLTEIDLDMEQNYAAYNECDLIHLELDFLRSNISYEVFNYGNESFFYSEPATAASFDSMIQNFSEFMNRAHEHSTARMTTDHSLELVIDSISVFGILDSFRNAIRSFTETETLTYENFCGINDLNFFCSYGRSVAGERSSSAGLTISLNDSFDLTVSGEYSDNSIHVVGIIMHKNSGISFGIEFEFSLKSMKLNSYIVLKFPFFDIECVIKFSIVGAVVSVLFRSTKNNDKKDVDKKGKGKKDDDKKGKKDDDKKGKGKKVDTYKQEAAVIQCNLIYLEIDFLGRKITHEIYEYETIKDYASSIEITNDMGNLVDEQLRPVHETLYRREEEFCHRKEFSISENLKKVADVALDMATQTVDSVVETVKDFAVEIKKKLPVIAAGGLCIVGGVALAVALPILVTTAIPTLVVPALATAPIMMLQRFM